MRRRGIGRQLRSRRKLITIWGTLLLIVVVYRLQQQCPRYFGKSCGEVVDDLSVFLPWIGWTVVSIACLGVIYLFSKRSRRSGSYSIGLEHGGQGKGARHNKAVTILPTDTEKILQYWKTCLIEATRAESSEREVRQFGAEIAFADLLNGRVPAETLELLAKKTTDANRSPRKSRASLEQFAEERRGNIQILLCPLRFTWSALSDAHSLGMPRSVDVLWIPAVINEQGELMPQRGRGPWIPRSLLEPISGEESLVVGELEAVEKFTRRHPFEDFSSWKTYWRQCDRFFEAVSGESIADFAIDDYTKRKNPCAVVDRSSQGAMSPAFRIYDHILRGRRDIGLLKKLATLRERKPIYIKNTVRELNKGALRHVGQFTDKFPLSVSQRRAIHYALCLDTGDVLTVTGPPGTGKTTFIQCLIAALWVNAARYKNGPPPILLVCAGTNQAVTNVIKSFAERVSGTNPLAQRWLPEVWSYGCYCPAEAKADSATDVHIERITGDGLSRSMETWEYVAAAKQLYLSNCARYFNKQLSVTGAVELFRRKINHLLSDLYRKTNQAAYGDTINALLALVGAGKSVSLKEYEKTLASFDITSRHMAFLLATHYWEGRWLLAVEDSLSRRAAGVINTEFCGGKEDWRRRAMVTPCFVATFATAPRFFAGEVDESPLVDTLIVDEASQVLPEEGAAAFSLAKRAVVVGDPQQLEPVCNIPEYVDVENLKQHALVKKGNEDELRQLYKKGLTSARGSLMLLAQNACRIIDQNTIGIFLSEHRRSVPGIVAYVNSLAYGSRLIPLRPPIAHQLFPAFGYAHIPGASQMVGPSWKNMDEASAIAEWLVKNEKRITSEYKGRSLESIVAVITPFTAQKRALESLVHKRFPKLTVGTVHALQGAERDIIIFSPVYDQFHRGRFFFDRSIHMLNVGVSRAKDSFLVFGDMGIFNPQLDSPSGILARFLFHEASQEICDFKLSPRMGYSENEIRRFTTLEEHRTVLKESLERASRELLIVSPTVSSRAINSDAIPEMISRACSRGVKILVYVDAYLNIDDKTGELRDTAREGCMLMRQAGAEVFVVKGIHNKTLAIDDHTIVEGSFNWLSAVRDISSANQKYEVSICYSGAKVRGEIENTKELLRSLNVYQGP